MRQTWAWPLAALITTGALVGCEDGETSPLPTQPQGTEEPTNLDNTPTATATAPGGGTPTAPSGTPTQGATPTPGDTPGDTPTQPGPTPTEIPGTPTVPATPPRNNAPTAELTAPSDGASFFLGQAVTFAGVVSDFESAPTDLSLSLVSSLDGDLGAPQVDGSGNVSLTAFDLTAGEHLVTLTATDPGGQSGQDSVTVTVEARAGVPTIAIDSPQAGGRVQLGDEVSFSVTVSDGEDAADALTVVWTSSIDGEIDRRTAQPDGTSAFTLTTLSRGVHTLTAEVIDSEANTFADGATLTVNAAPSDPVITFAPEAPRTADDIRAEALSQDLEGDDIGYAFSWTVDGADAGIASDTVPADRTTRGQLWAVTVTASDPDVSSAPATASVTVANTPPTSTGASLSPAEATASTTLSCAGEGFADADGDDARYNYSWQVSGEDLIGVTGDTLSGRFSRGDTVTCFATPFDGIAAGIRKASAQVTIDNAPPTIPTPAISPSEDVTAEDTLSCTSGPVVDPDGDDLEVSYAWLRGGEAIPGATEATLTSPAFAKDDTLTCQITATDDGGATTTAASAPVTVGNATPRVTAIAITPESPASEDPLVCQVSTSDADPADSVSLSYSWTIDDAVVEGATDATLPAGTAERGEIIRCLATPSDGTATGETATSDPVTLDNTAPSIEGVTITPSDPTASSTLTCIPTGYDDAEGDEAIYAYAWTVSGADAGIAEATLTSASFAKGDEITCTVTPSDGFVDGPAVTSEAVTIANTPPVVTDIHITPAAPTVDSTLTCNVTTADVDEDEVDVSFSWAVDGATVPGATGDTLDPESFAGAETITCTATPADDDESGAAATSAPVSVGNLAPSEPQVELIPEGPLPGEPLEVIIVSESVDPDGDEVSYTYRWTVGGVPTSWDGPTIPALHTTDGQVWAVEVRGTDGSAESDAATDSVTVDEPDGDGDGYGFLSDCDDTSATVHPGAAEPINGQDDDCDGVSDNRWPVDHPFGRADVGEVSAVAVGQAGIAHMLYLDRSHNRVRYGRIEDESALYVDTPDNTVTTLGASELPLAIAVGPDDVPHVALYDTTSQDLIYATRIGTRWVSTVVDEVGDVGARPSIAVDSFGNAHIAYYDQDNDALKYARGVTGLFFTQTIQAGLTSGVYHDIAVDVDGGAHLAWQATFTGKLRYAHLVDGEGTPEDVPTVGNAGNNVRIAVDPVTSEVHMAYVNGTTGNVDYVTGTSGAFSREVALTDVDPLGRIALAVNPATGAPHILVYDGSDQNLYHVHAEAGGWDPSLAVGFTEAIGYNPSVTIDTDQVLHATFFLANSEDFIYATARAAGSWGFNLYTVENIDQGGAYNDVAVGVDGQPRLYTFGVLRSSGDEFGLFLGQDGDGFLVRSPNSGASSHIYGQIEVDVAGASHILEWDPTTSEVAHLRSADGYTWVRTELADDLYTTNGLSLDVTPGGGVYAAYTDYWGSRPLVCTFQTPNYTEVTLVSRPAGQSNFSRQAVVYTCSSSSTMPLAYPSIAATSTALHLALYRQSNGDLIYMQRDADGEWAAPVVVDSADDTGYRPSIAINPATGLPVIAHINRTSGKLRLSTRNQVGWLSVNVADAHTPGPVVLRIDNEGAIHLLFRDATGRRLQYATNRSGSFVTEVVALRGDALDLGNVAGMELDPDGNPHISFQDLDSGDVAYVRGKVFPSSF